MNKVFKSIIVLICVGLLGYTLLQHKTTTPDISQGSTQKDLCYIWNTEAGDSASLRMTITNNTAIKGSFSFVPAEKDAKRGPFIGEVGTDSGDMHTALLTWGASAEGATATEQLFVKFSDTTAAAGFGEMKQQKDGTYIYAHPDQISYAPVLQATQCDDSALR